MRENNLKKKMIVVCIMTCLLMFCAGCGGDSMFSKLECTIETGGRAASQMWGNFSLMQEIEVKVSGGSGAYDYYYTVYNADTGEALLENKYSTVEEKKLTKSSFAFTIYENVPLDIVLEVEDSNGKKGTFEHHIDKYVFE